MGGAAIARNVVGVIGNVISFGLFFSPAPTFFGIIKKKSVEEFKPDPYLATVLNCAFWVFYGLPFVHPHSILVVTINSVGLVFEFVYLTIFCIYATNKGRKKVVLFLFIEVIFFAAVVLTTMLALHGTHRRSLVVGVLCDVFNVMMYVSPLTIMAKVIKTKSVKYMPFWLSLANFLNGVCWTTYALIHPFDIYVLVINEQAKVIKTKSVKYMPFWLSLANFLNGVCWTTYALIHPFDIYVLISNGIGAISGLVQLILYACYCSYKGEKDDDDGDHDLKPSGVQLSSLNGRSAV